MSKPSISIKVILTFLKLILTLNNFLFNGINYLQKKSCTMHRAMQIFLWVGLRKSLYFAFLTNLSDFYLLFIDNIFLIWNGTKTGFDNFLKKNNECHPSIKFEYEMSKTEINFLKTTVFKLDNKM